MEYAKLPTEQLSWKYRGLFPAGGHTGVGGNGIKQIDISLIRKEAVSPISDTGVTGISISLILPET